MSLADEFCINLDEEVIFGDKEIGLLNVSKIELLKENNSVGQLFCKPLSYEYMRNQKYLSFLLHPIVKKSDSCKPCQKT